MSDGQAAALSSDQRGWSGRRSPTRSATGRLTPGALA